MAEQKERAAKLEAQLQAFSSAPTAAAAMPVGQRQPVVANISENKLYDSACKARSLALSEWRTVAPASRCAYNDDDERAVTMCGWEGNRGPAESNDTLLPGLLTVVTSLLTA